MQHLLLIALGGAAGSVLRYLVSLYTPSLSGSNWFLSGTFIVNIAGCFLIGLLSQWIEERQLVDSGLRLLVLAGFLGGFTTFSTFGLEGFTLLQQSPLQAMIYIVMQVIFGIGAVWLGIYLCRMWMA